MTSDDSASIVSVLARNGDDTLRTKVDYSTGWVPRSVAAVDVNHDGRPDLVVVSSFDNPVCVLLATGLR